MNRIITFPVFKRDVRNVDEAIELIKKIPEQSNIKIFIARRVPHVTMKLYNETGRRFKTKSSGGGTSITYMRDIKALDEAFRNVEPGEFYAIHFDESHDIYQWHKWFKEQSYLKGMYVEFDHDAREFIIKRR